MNFDFADLLMDVVARRASDLHITAGAPPMVRVRGRLVGVEGYPRLSPTDTREVVCSIPSGTVSSISMRNATIRSGGTCPTVTAATPSSIAQRASNACSEVSGVTGLTT